MPKCKQETIINVEQMNITVMKELVAQPIAIIIVFDVLTNSFIYNIIAQSFVIIINVSNTSLVICFKIYKVVFLLVFTP